ncbi:MAG: hypothetical protein K0M45_02575 [Candidatus Paracaedibacteraceae bacterium]|nr:hypothetical protein [Candidatus Paracaedibacteraceae bacterium]
MIGERLLLEEILTAIPQEPTVLHWRWLISHEQTMPWNPSVRLFRHSKTGDWVPLVQRVREELQIARK